MTWTRSTLLLILFFSLPTCATKKQELVPHIWTDKTHLMVEMQLREEQCLCLKGDEYVAGEKEVNDLVAKCQIIQAQRDQCYVDLEKAEQK